MGACVPGGDPGALRAAEALRRRGDPAEQSRRGADGPAVYRARRGELCRSIQERPEAGAGRDQRRHRAADAAKAGRGQEVRSSRPLRSTRPARRRGTTWVWRNMRAMSSRMRWPAFKQAVKLDPRDADSWYFEGACYQEMKQFDKADRDLREDARRSIRCTRRLSSPWRGRCNARATPRRRRNTLRVFSI